MIHSLMYLLNHGDLPYNYVKLPDGNKHLKCPRYLRDLPSVSEKNMSFWKILQHLDDFTRENPPARCICGEFSSYGSLGSDNYRYMEVSYQKNLQNEEFIMENPNLKGMI